tara:strand:+ start:504 stop:779 length:276 start_codon:yes stop_codon:yes gene_type:complete
MTSLGVRQRHGDKNWLHELPKDSTPFVKSQTPTITITTITITTNKKKISENIMTVNSSNSDCNIEHVCCYLFVVICLSLFCDWMLTALQCL